MNSLAGRCSESVTTAQIIDRCDTLIRLVCSAAREGIQADHTALFADIRAWMCANREQITTLAVAYQQDHIPGSFAPLFEHDDLVHVINMPAGIDVMYSARAALDGFATAVSRPDQCGALALDG